MWPEDSFLDMVPDDADMSGEGEEMATSSEGELDEDQWFCMDTVYGYQLGWYLVKAEIGFKGCDYSLLDKFLDSIDFDCAYNTFYFNNILQDTIWGNEQWGLYYGCPWSEGKETTKFKDANMKDSIKNDLDENAL